MDLCAFNPIEIGYSSSLEEKPGSKEGSWKIDVITLGESKL